MLKRIIIIACFVLLWTSMGFAEEHWLELGTYDGAKMSIDTESVNRRDNMRYDIYKAKVKLEYNDGSSSIQKILVNTDTRQYSLISDESFMNGKKINSFSYNKEWYDSDFQNFNVFVDKVIEMQEKLERH